MRKYPIIKVISSADVTFERYAIYFTSRELDPEDYLDRVSLKQPEVFLPYLKNQLLQFHKQLLSSNQVSMSKVLPVQVGMLGDPDDDSSFVRNIDIRETCLCKIFVHKYQPCKLLQFLPPVVNYKLTAYIAPGIYERHYDAGSYGSGLPSVLYKGVNVSFVYEVGTVGKGSSSVVNELVVNSIQYSSVPWYAGTREVVSSMTVQTSDFYLERGVEFFTHTFTPPPSVIPTITSMQEAIEWYLPYKLNLLDTETEASERRALVALEYLIECSHHGRITVNLWDNLSDAQGVPVNIYKVEYIEGQFISSFVAEFPYQLAVDVTSDMFPNVSHLGVTDRRSTSFISLRKGTHDWAIGNTGLVDKYKHDIELIMDYINSL